MGNVKLNYIQGENGYSLVELIVAIFLLLITLAIGFSFFFFGLNSFVTGELNSNVQQNVRLKAKYISDEVRYATEMEILATKPSDAEFNDSYNYMYLDDGKIMVKKGAEAAYQVPVGISEGIEFSLDFYGNEIETSMIKFLISGKKNEGKKYEVSSEVSVLNLTYIPNVSGTAIKYRDKVFLVITNTDLNYSINGEPYEHKFLARGGNPPYYFTGQGEIPLGLFLNSGGEFSGTPANEGYFTFKVTVTDAEGDISSHEFTIQVKPPKLGASIETISGITSLRISNVRNAATIKIYRVNEPEPVYTFDEDGDTYIDLVNDISLTNGDYFTTQTVNGVTSERSDVINISI